MEDDGNVYEQVGVGPEAVELHPLTYRYIPVQTEGSSPYGIPQMLPAMFGLDRKFALLDAEKRVINLMAHSALVKGTIPKPTPGELGLKAVNDPGYQDKLTAYVNQVADLLMQGSENGLYQSKQLPPTSPAMSPSWTEARSRRSSRRPSPRPPGSSARAAPSKAYSLHRRS